MAMEANTYESHDSVQALADVGLTLALSKGRGNANTKKDGLEIARAAARAPSTRRAAPPAEDAHGAYLFDRWAACLRMEVARRSESSVRCWWWLSGSPRMFGAALACAQAKKCRPHGWRSRAQGEAHEKGG